MVTIPILASEHRADSLTVNHSRKVVPVWVSRVETILRQCAQQTTWPSQVVGSGVADELDKIGVAARARRDNIAGVRHAQETADCESRCRFITRLRVGFTPPSPSRLARRALLQRLAAVRGRLSLCADQAAAAKWWLSMPMASVSAEGPMPKALSTRRTSPLMPGCRHQGRACPLRRARMTSNPLIVA